MSNGKVAMNFLVDVSIKKKLDEIAKKSGKTKTAIVSGLICNKGEITDNRKSCYYDSEYHFDLVIRKQFFDGLCAKYKELFDIECGNDDLDCIANFLSEFVERLVSIK